MSVHIVTGVSKGIGKALVQRLLDQGDQVAGWGRTNSIDKNENYQFFEVDVRDDSRVKRAADETIHWANAPISSLINNAGLGIFRPLDETDPEEWRLMFDTNVHGIFHCCRHLIPHFKSNNAGTIVNISSIAGTTGIPEASAYCGTKHAVRGITHSLFKELRKWNIKVCCVYPGSVNTEFFTHYEGVTANPSMLDPNDVATAIEQVINSSPNFVTTDIEIRPINPVYK